MSAGHREPVTTLYGLICALQRKHTPVVPSNTAMLAKAVVQYRLLTNPGDVKDDDEPGAVVY
jgi:hypothetical protein